MADDPTVVRRVRVALRYAAAYRVAATVDGRFAVRSCLSELRPDLVLVDAMCQRRNTFARLREIRDVAPATTAVLLYDATDPELVGDAFACGACAALSRRLHPAAMGVLLGEIGAGTLASRTLRSQWADAAATTSA